MILHHRMSMPHAEANIALLIDADNAPASKGQNAADTALIIDADDVYHAGSRVPRRSAEGRKS
jgi:hypothetical protein